jgi:hypothetical protein
MGSSAGQLDFIAILQALPEQANASPVLRRLGRLCSMEFLLQCDGQCAHVRVERGEVAPVIPGPLRMRAWQFAIRAPEASWRRFWQPVPAVGFSDIFAMVRFGHASIEGDIGPMLTHLRLVKEILALPRGATRAPRT